MSLSTPFGVQVWLRRSIGCCLIDRSNLVSQETETRVFQTRIRTTFLRSSIPWHSSYTDTVVVHDCFLTFPVTQFVEFILLAEITMNFFSLWRLKYPQNMIWRRWKHTIILRPWLCVRSHVLVADMSPPGDGLIPLHCSWCLFGRRNGENGTQRGFPHSASVFSVSRSFCQSVDIFQSSTNYALLGAPQKVWQ
jgi:hypothetical protein